MIRTKKTQPGFTLIEMLVVMAIVVILATLVLAVTVRSLKKAEETKKVSDTRQENISTFIDTVQSGKGHDDLPEHIQKGEFGEKGSEPSPSE